MTPFAGDPSLPGEIEPPPTIPTFTVEARSFFGAVSQAARLSAARDVVPALTGLRVAAYPGVLRILGTDLEAGVEMSVAADVAEPGTLVVPARRLQELLRHVPPEEPIRCRPSQGHAELSFGRSRFELVTFPPDTFPAVAFPEAEVGRLDGPSFREAVGRVGYAVSTRDDMFAVLLGISVKLASDTMELTASDNFRLAWCRVRGVKGPEEPVNFVVRGRLLGELARLVGDDEVAVQLEERRVGFAAGEVRAFAQRIVGTFPDHRQLLAKPFPTRARLRVAELLTAVERAALVTDAQNPQVWLTLSAEEGLALRAESADAGGAFEPVAAEVEGEAMELAFQPRYLIEALRAVDAEEAWFSFSGPGSTATLVPVDRPDDQLAIVLPLRT